MTLFSGMFGRARSLLRLALPVALAQVGNITVQIADSAMVGRFGGEDDTPLAAVAFGANISWLFLFLCIGVAIGLTPVIGELFVQHRRQEMAHYLQTSLWLYPLFGVVCMVVQIVTEPLLYHLGQEVEVVDMALPYYRLMAYSLPFITLYGSIKQFLEGVGNTKVAMIVAIATNLVNVVLNYLFIFGKGGFDAMGVYGAGLATLISRMIGPILLGAYFVLSKRYREYVALFSRRVEHWRNAIRLLKLGFPIAGQMVLEALAFIVTGIMMGWFGKEALSANQVGNTYGNCTFMMILSLGSATTICVSHAFGRRDMNEVREFVRSSLAMALVWGVGVIVAFVSLRHTMPLLFTANKEVVALASQMLIIYATYQLSDALQCILVGVLRGLQQVKSIARISFISYIVLNIPVGYFVAFELNMGPTGLLVGYIVGLSTAALLYGVQVVRYMRSHR